MAIVNEMTSYDLNGKKLSFANWISNISPTDTPFTSMTGKEGVTQTTFQWQTDVLPPVDLTNAQIEGSKPTDAAIIKTTVKQNNTQILRKVVQVSDTANIVAAYGRGREVQYQMEKAGAEIKRDLEFALLTQGNAVAGSATTARTTAGFTGLVAALNAADTDTGAIVHKKTGAAGKFTEAQLFDLTYELYLANSKANVIMFHPQHAAAFAGLVENAGNVAGVNREKMFGSTDDKLNVFVDTVIDPLGQKFALVPNRFMPADKIYFFNPSDWTQMVFRAPQRTELAKEGSYEKWMIEMEVGLRHRNPYASGVLELVA